jgi:hypothetical protein
MHFIAVPFLKLAPPVLCSLDEHCLRDIAYNALMLHERRGWIRERKDQENTMGLIQTSVHAPSLLPGAAQRYRLGGYFSSPSPVVCVAVFNFACRAITQALQECTMPFHFLKSFYDFRQVLNVDSCFRISVIIWEGPPSQSTIPLFWHPMIDIFIRVRRPRTIDTPCKLLMSKAITLRIMKIIRGYAIFGMFIRMRRPRTIDTPSKLLMSKAITLRIMKIIRGYAIFGVRRPRCQEQRSDTG